MVLPKVPEHVVNEVMHEVNSFVTFLKHDFEGARKSVGQDIEWLRENKGFLGISVKTFVNAMLELYGEKLSQ